MLAVIIRENCLWYFSALVGRSVSVLLSSGWKRSKLIQVACSIYTRCTHRILVQSIYCDTLPMVNMPINFFIFNLVFIL
uniref:Uncharacterized protein n=1 Tax=Arundo donax TaxID=35708 RepID=A0A0A9CWD0_ARUDO